MTNEQIIWSARCDLMDKGIIGTTGHIVEIRNADDTVTAYKEPEPIHTFAVWKTNGYCVKKGEHAIIDLQIWKHKTKKSEDKGQADQNIMFLTKAFFFAPSQVERIEEVAQ